MKDEVLGALCNLEIESQCTAFRQACKEARRSALYRVTGNGAQDRRQCKYLLYQTTKEHIQKTNSYPPSANHMLNRPQSPRSQRARAHVHVLSLASAPNGGISPIWSTHTQLALQHADARAPCTYLTWSWSQRWRKPVSPRVPPLLPIPSCRCVVAQRLQDAVLHSRIGAAGPRFHASECAGDARAPKLGWPGCGLKPR